MQRKEAAKVSTGQRLWDKMTREEFTVTDIRFSDKEGTSFIFIDNEGEPHPHQNCEEADL